jgi:hypothetical protein
MGNNNSTHGNKVDVVNETKYNDDLATLKRGSEPLGEDLLKQFYAKNTESEANKISENIYDKADTMYEEIWDNGEHDLYVKRKIKVDVYADPSRGITLPYISDRNAYESESKNDLLTSSENPRYIEFIICKGNLSDIHEKYAIHKTTPNHDCRGDCNCIQETLEVIGNKSRIYDQPSSVLQSISPTNAKDYAKDYANVKSCKTEAVQQPQQPQPHHHHHHHPSSSDIAFSPTSDESINATQTPTSTDIYKMHERFLQSQNKPVCRPMLGGAIGGAKRDESIESETSPEEITDSEEQTEGAFSSTSEMSDTTTSPAFGNKKKDNDKDKNKNKRNTLFTKDNDENEDDENLDLDEDIEEETNVDDEDLEGLDEEEITEEGFILDQSDISSTDLYKMQSRVFKSDTETPVQSVKFNAMKTNNAKFNNDNDDETTERVRKAMTRANLRTTQTRRTKRTSRTNRSNRSKGLFDSEDANIFRMNSSTDEYMKRPVNRSIKHN